ncbi:hypothetical protein [Porphyromonas canoris]|uniref:hypothetical protein n=1 Tax=Porphyromonas canoris TaxID=36875 RepID=UPI000A81D6EF|nr:hypothetical protein [Porphyromonas canoris]
MIKEAQEEEPFLSVKGKVDMPGVLASGSVDYYGELQSGSYGKATDASRLQQEVGTG